MGSADGWAGAGCRERGGEGGMCVVCGGGYQL
jgi:hypothetical protein